MTSSTLNRFVAPVAAAALAATTVVAPVALTASGASLPNISISHADIDLVVEQVFNPDVPLINWDNIGVSPLTPIPQLLLSGLMNPVLLIPTFSVIAPYLSAVAALPVAGLIGGPDHILASLASEFPALAGIADGYNDFAQSAAGFLGDIPLIGQPIQTAFMMMPLLSQWLLASVVNPLPMVFDTSDFWGTIGGFLTGDDDGVGSAAGGLFDFDLSGLLGSFDLGSLFDSFDLSGLLGGFDLGIAGLLNGLGDALNIDLDIDLSWLLGDLDIDLGIGDLSMMALAPLSAVGLTAMLAPLAAGIIPLAVASWAGSMFLDL